jgi:diguanylate cyclase (GGDEF)-like protein
MSRFRFLIVPFLPLALMFGAFNMTSRQYIGMAVLIVVGYAAVIGLVAIRDPESVRPDQEILSGAVFVLIILAFSLVGNEISRLRRKLRQRNADLAEAIQKMEQMAITDELTGLINRRQMMFILGKQKAVADRGGARFSACFFDIDRFKSINDTMGHHVGDFVLKRLAEEARKSLRTSDTFARFGGEEFVLLASGANLGSAAIVADRIRNIIRTIDFSDIASSLTVTLSGGVAQYRPKEEIRSILTRADEALYLAKNSGRNCIKLEING